MGRGGGGGKISRDCGKGKKDLVLFGPHQGPPPKKHTQKDTKKRRKKWT
jgi:hypothetical protein